VSKLKYLPLAIQKSYFNTKNGTGWCSSS